MKKTTKKLWGIIGMILGLLVSIGVGGLFINGTFLNVVILEWLPLIVHQVAGWLIIGVTAVSVLYGIFK